MRMFLYRDQRLAILSPPADCHKRESGSTTDNIMVFACGKHAIFHKGKTLPFLAYIRVINVICRIIN